MEFLNNINTMLVDRFGELAPLYVLGGLGLLMIVMTLPVFLRKRIDPLDKLKKQQKQARVETDAQQRLRRDGDSKLDKYASFLEPKNEEEMGATRLKLMRAGYRAKNSVQVFHFAQLALAISGLGLGLLYSILTNTSDTPPTPMQLILPVMIPGLVGYYLPKYWIERRLQTRQEEIINGFPDSLDMMLVCVEAGQSLDQSILRVSKEVKAGYPALAEEYETVSHEVKAGKDRVQVLKDMGERCGVADISSFVTVLVQSASFGTSIAEALRVFSDEMRDKRVMRAEEKANVLPTKLTLGTMMFTVPPLLIVLIGPSVFEIAETLTGANF